MLSNEVDHLVFVFTWLRFKTAESIFTHLPRVFFVFVLIRTGARLVGMHLRRLFILVPEITNKLLRLSRAPPKTKPIHCLQQKKLQNNLKTQSFEIKTQAPLSWSPGWPPTDPRRRSISVCRSLQLTCVRAVDIWVPGGRFVIFFRCPLERSTRNPHENPE